MKRRKLDLTYFRGEVFENNTRIGSACMLKKSEHCLIGYVSKPFGNYLICRPVLFDVVTQPRPPASMFPESRRNKKKVGNVIQHTRGKGVKNVSVLQRYLVSETVMQSKIFILISHLDHYIHSVKFANNNSNNKKPRSCRFPLKVLNRRAQVFQRTQK